MHLQSQYNMHQQEHQQAGYHPAYPGAQPYNGWPGIALKQIMGQIDFLNNFQGTNNANYPKWNLPKDHTGSNNNVNGYTHHNGNERPMHVTPGTQNNVPLPPHQGQPHTPQLPPLPPPSSSRHQQGNFKFNQSYEYPQPVADTSTAWLGPHMWNRKLGLDVSGDRGHHHQGHKFSIENGQADEQNKIKTESSDDLEWFTNLDVKSPSDIEEVATQSQDDDFSQADLALASAPGFKFNPRTRCFTPDELKPQPIIRKRRKMYVSDSDKNEDYWAKRVKNNVAARRSREARRLKENQIALRAAFLERENSALRSQVRVLNVRNEEMKKDVEKLLDNIKILTDTDSNSSSSISNSASPGSVES